jgi:hypothetical protein
VSATEDQSGSGKDNVCATEGTNIVDDTEAIVDNNTIDLPAIPANYPESWVILLQEWKELNLDSYIPKSVERAAWSRSYQICFSKRYRGMRMLRQLQLPKSKTITTARTTNCTSNTVTTTTSADTIASSVYDDTTISDIFSAAAASIKFIDNLNELQTMAKQLDIVRYEQKKSLSNRLIDYEKNDFTIQRRERKR